MDQSWHLWRECCWWGTAWRNREVVWRSTVQMRRSLRLLERFQCMSKPNLCRESLMCCRHRIAPCTKCSGSGNWCHFPLSTLSPCYTMSLVTRLIVFAFSHVSFSLSFLRFHCCCFARIRFFFFFYAVCQFHVRVFKFSIISSTSSTSSNIVSSINFRFIFRFERFIFQIIFKFNFNFNFSFTFSTFSVSLLVIVSLLVVSLFFVLVSIVFTVRNIVPGSCGTVVCSHTLTHATVRFLSRFFNSYWMDVFLWRVTCSCFRFSRFFFSIFSFTGSTCFNVSMFHVFVFPGFFLIF